MMRNKLFQAMIMVLIVGSTAAMPTYAQTPSPAGGSVHQGFFQGLLTFIEQKFHLDKTQVDSAVKEYKQSHPRPTMSPQLMTDREKMRLDKLVNAKKITADQETAILSELSSLESKYNLGSNQNLTPDQRKSAMQSFVNDLKSWAQSQNIPLQYVTPGFGMMGRGQGMMHGKFGKWQNPSGTPTPTPTPTP